tara:strand:- start:1308 stop:1667 length:360 start_codon:yes stop_codon:yes gene_type:complete
MDVLELINEFLAEAVSLDRFASSLIGGYDRKGEVLWRDQFCRGTRRRFEILESAAGIAVCNLELVNDIFESTGEAEKFVRVSLARDVLDLNLMNDGTRKATVGKTVKYLHFDAVNHFEV